MTQRALRILEEGRAGAYEQALQALEPGTRSWWVDLLAEGDEDQDGDDETSWQPMAADLQRFLETEVHGWYEKQHQQIASRPAVRRQAFGESLDPHRAARLQAHDMRLDRQLERILAMLLKLQDLRGRAERIGAGGQTLVRYIFHSVLMIRLITMKAAVYCGPQSEW